jgi:xanthine dehydrogenase accessory factor
MDTLYKEIRMLLQKGESAVLATIVRQAGPSPRGLGTKFLIREDGSFVGTIGGGLLEAQTLQASAKVFESGLPLLLRFSMTGTDVAKTDMLCGGTVEIFLEPISPSRIGTLEFFRALVETANRGVSGLLATPLEAVYWKEGTFPLLFFEKGGKKNGSLPGSLAKGLMKEMDRIISSRQPVQLLLPDERGGTAAFYVEPMISDPVLYIFGGGHVSRQIVPLANLVGFHVEVIDDRPEFAVVADFPGARSVHLLHFEGVMDLLAVDPSSFLVIVTRGHMYDKTVLEQALRTEAQYIGMIGSRRKREVIYAKLLEEGFSTEDLARVYSPIGLAIGAETPEEIAVSIVAELIQVRAGQNQA